MMGMKKYALKFFTVLALTLILTGCTFATNDPLETPGFLMGFWHGVVAPYTLIVRFFIDIKMYAISNAGVTYDLGFLIGLIFSIPVGWMATIISILFFIFA